MKRMDALSLCHGSVVEVGIINEDIANYTIFEVRALSGGLHSIVDEHLTKKGDE